MFYKILIPLILSFQVFAFDVKPVELKSFQNKQKVSLDFSKKTEKVVLNFWASWCTSCIGELPKLNQLKEQYAKQGVEFYAINAGETDGKIKKFLKRHKFTYEVLMDKDKSYSKSVGVESLPITLVIEKNKIVFAGTRPPADL